MSDANLATPQKTVSATDLSSHKRRFVDLFEQQPQGFDSAEHRRLGDSVSGFQPRSLEDVYDADWKAGLIDIGAKVKLKYGQIVALAGDLYGVPSRPISSGKDENDRRARFNEAFNTLVNAKEAELRAILGIMDRERDSIDASVRTGMTADAAYEDAPDFDDEYMRATGGSNVVTDKGRYIELALTNFDHFGPSAVQAYSTGHAVAVEKALSAARTMASRGQTKEGREAAFKEYQVALGMCAFADHYLTDLFSAGHLRVPRRVLAESFDTLAGLYGAGSMLAKFQHEEDGRLGLFVKNRAGHCWRCFGDGHLQSPAGAENARLAKMAIQRSTTDILSAFNDGRAPAAYGALELIPDVEEAMRREVPKNRPNPANFAAAFINRDGKIAGRTPFEDVNSHKWVDVKSTFDNAPPKPAWAGGSRPPSTASSISEFLKYASDKIGLEQTPFTEPVNVLTKPTVAPTVSYMIPRSGPPATVLLDVRWAVCFVGTKVYPDGSTAEYMTNPGPWSAWCGVKANEIYVLDVPTDPSGLATKRVISRQSRDMEPEWRFGEVPDNTTMVFADLKS